MIEFLVDDGRIQDIIQRIFFGQIKIFQADRQSDFLIEVIDSS